MTALLFHLNAKGIASGAIELFTLKNYVVALSKNTQYKHFLLSSKIWQNFCNSNRIKHHL